MSGAKIKQFFVQASKTSLLVIFLVSVVVSSVSIVVTELSTQKAQAAVAPADPITFTWENHVTIVDDGGNFWRNDNGRDGLTKYLRVGDVDVGCVDYIEFFMKSQSSANDNGYLLSPAQRSSGTLHILKPSTSETNKNCQDTSKTISLKNPDAHVQLYYWQSKTTIQRLQGYDEIPPVAYQQSTTDPTRYIEEGNASCPDLIYVSADKKTAKYIGQSDRKGEMQNINWFADGEHNYEPADQPAGTNCYKTIEKDINLTLQGNATVEAKDAKGVPTTATGTAAADGASCYGFSPFSWVLCPILDLADGVYGFARDVISDLLYIEPNDVNDTGLKQSWSIMRGLASTLIVLVALVMIASQIFSFEFMTAYTIKKVLPRLVIAAILIQLSWFIFTTLIFIVNGIGAGLYALLTQPFNGVGGGDIMDIAGQIKASGAVGSVFSQATIFTAIVGAGAFAVGSVMVGGATLSIILTAVGVIISILITIFTLIVRKILILLLLTLAPLALVAWILPNTTKYWDMWWKLFSKLLLMFPLIMLLFASGVIAANVFALTGKSDPISYLIILIAYFAPLFLIPSTFKFAGGLFGSLVSAIDKAGNKAKGSGMFGYRDRAKLSKDNSIWASTRKSRNTDRTNRAINQNAQQLSKGTGFVANAMRRRSGLDDAGRRRALANAASVIDAEKDNKFKEQAALVSYQVDQMAEQEKQESLRKGEAVRDLYDRRVSARNTLLADASLDKSQGAEFRAQVALQSLAQKDKSVELDEYLDKPGGFGAVKDLGGSSQQAYTTLKSRLPTAVKGADVASLDAPQIDQDGNIKLDGSGNQEFATGFDNAIEVYADLRGTQQKQIHKALNDRLANGNDEAIASVVTRLNKIARDPETRPDQLEKLQKDLGRNLNLTALSDDPNAVLSYNKTTNSFELTKT